MWEKVRPWILAARPKTLPATVAPVWIGSYLGGLAAADGVDHLLAWSAFLSALAIQIATNFFNDALDANKGADTNRRLGPTRASASGMLAPQAMMRAGLVMLVVAVLLSIPIVRAHGLPIVVIGLVSMACAYAYTGGPFPLAYRGMGEVFVIFFFGIVAVAGSMFVQTGRFDSLGVMVGIQVGLYSAVLIAINNARDRAEDERSRKFTLAVLFGQTFAELEIAAFCLLPLVLGWIYHLAGAFPWNWAVYPMWLLPLSVAIIWQVWSTPPSRAYNRFLAMSAAQLLGFAVLITIAGP